MWVCVWSVCVCVCLLVCVSCRTSHCPLRPLSCSRDQMLCILPACSGWLLLSPHVHWCFSIWESYTRPAFACTHIHTHTNTKKRDLTDFCFKYLQLHTFVAIEEGFSSFSKISNYFLLPVLSKAIRNNTFICYFNLVFTLDGYSCPQKDRETERSTSQAVNTNTNIISK